MLDVSCDQPALDAVHCSPRLSLKFSPWRRQTEPAREKDVACSGGVWNNCSYNCYQNVRVRFGLNAVSSLPEIDRFMFPKTDEAALTHTLPRPLAVCFVPERQRFNRGIL